MLFRPPYLRALGWLAALSAAIVAAGVVWETRQLGWSDAEAVARIAAGVRSTFAGTVAELQTISTSVASERDAIRRAPTALPATRDLFASLARRIDDDVSVTIYSTDHRPLAWAGRPSDLEFLRARIDGPAALFVAPGPSGAKLVKVQPVFADDTPGSRRIGVVVTERVLPISMGSDSPGGVMVWPTPLAQVQIITRYEGAGETRRANAFILGGPDDDPLLEGIVIPADITAARARLRGRTGAAVLVVVGFFLSWLALPLMAAIRGRTRVDFAVLRVAGAIISLLAARLCARYAASLAEIEPSLTPHTISQTSLRPFLDTPIDLLASGLFLLALVAVANQVVTRLRPAIKGRRVLAAGGWGPMAAFAAVQTASATIAVVAIGQYDNALRALASVPGIDLISFSLRPWDSNRLALSVAVLCMHAAVVWFAVTVLRCGLLWFNVGPSTAVRAVWALCWVVPVAIFAAMPWQSTSGIPAWALMVPAAVAIALAWASLRFAHWRRRASQSATIFAMFLALALPSYAMYPVAFAHASRARQQVVETQLAPQALDQREDLQLRVRQALTQIDQLRGLAGLAATPRPPAPGPPPTDAAFLVWSQTDLGAFRLTSAVELYAADGSLVSRFALNLPEYASAQQKWQEASCKWDLFEEVSPFGSEERRLLHAGRGLCVDTPTGPRTVGAIVVHAMLDYGALPFLTSQSPYVEFFRRARIPGVDTPHGRETQFAVYGWSRRPLYESASGTWTIDDATFRRIYASRQPFWIRQAGAGRTYDIYLANDRGAIYALGIPTLDRLGHLVLFAELGTLAGALYAFWLLVGAIGSALGLRMPDRGHDLFNEIRMSFYRKLAIGVVAAAVIPVLFLAALAQTYMSSQLRAGIDDAAVRTAAIAQRVVEDYGRLQERTENAGQPLTDDILVWISRVIDQDVSVYDGAQLEATSERDLFASGLLPTRTSASVFRAIALERRATFVDEERAGGFPYLVAAAPARVAGRDAILTVPLTLRQQAIEREIDALNRRILLAVVLFVLVGSGFGWWMAERIADPVRSLQRATERMSSGDLDIRLPMGASNELSRLVSAFNNMATDLRHHQEAAARTNKLEAWADMARQVAHEIKNPLTPIQLSAEHLRRVHADHGSPLGSVLDNCVDSILTQVRLLRQIAGDFSSFASSPTPRPVEVEAAALIEEVLAPYRTGLPTEIRLSVDTPASLPALSVDRSLIGRALANVVENALHAMPRGGALGVAARMSQDGRSVELVVTDTGFGMEQAALGRIFEPYFSTKAIGTGLGLTIVKRNVELHGGTIVVTSEPGVGTTVTIALPVQL